MSVTIETKSPILQMKNIHAGYGAHQALKGVDFDLYPGEIHGLVGEHRAGKSTLVKVLGGDLRKTDGHILLKDKLIPYFTPKSAIEHKIGIMYQESQVIPTLNAVENIFAMEPIRHWWWGIFKYPTMRKQAKEIFSLMGVSLDLTLPLRHLSKGEQQMVELAKVLSIHPEIIIFDEISSRLTPEEMEIIYTCLFDWKQQGRSVIYISHNMDEIFKFADRVTILKDGHKFGTEEIKDLDKVKLLKLTYSFVLSRDELESDNRELYLLKRYNENIIRNLPEGVIILNPDNRVYIMNDAAAQILDLDWSVVMEQPPERIFRREGLESADDIIQKIQLCEEGLWEELEYGDEKLVKIHSFPFKDEDYKFLGTIVIVEDISKELALQEYLLRTEKIASIAELAAGVAHEINNPLEIIQNYITALKDKKLDRDSLERLDRVEKELDRIVGIIGSLLSFSTLQSFPMESIDLVALLDEVVTLVDHKLKEKQIHFLWEKTYRTMPIIGDENRLKQVFVNLLINSIEAVIYAGEIELKLNVHRENGYVEASITDDGNGIPKETMKRIFDPFFSTKAGKKNSGLGLSICQHIIESHQGLITCASGERTTFKVRLPLIESV